MSPKPRKPSPLSSPAPRQPRPHREAFRQLAELQMDAIAAAKSMLMGMEPADLITLIKMCSEAITTHRAVVTEDDGPEASSAGDDRLDTPTEGEREA